MITPFCIFWRNVAQTAPLLKPVTRSWEGNNAKSNYDAPRISFYRLTLILWLTAYPKFPSFTYSPRKNLIRFLKYTIETFYHHIFADVVCVSSKIYVNYLIFLFIVAQSSNAHLDFTPRWLGYCKSGGYTDLLWLRPMEFTLVSI